MNLYGILGVARDADDDTIRVAYRSLVRRYHPDRGTGSSVEKFRQVIQAYEILSDPERRRMYDRSLPSGPPRLVAPVESIGMRLGPLESGRLASSWDSLFDVLGWLLENDFPGHRGGRWWR